MGSARSLIHNSGSQGILLKNCIVQQKRDRIGGKFLPNSSVVVELALGGEGYEEKQDAIASFLLSQFLELNSKFANYVISHFLPMRKI
jgi:hypothetical protein